MDPSESMEVIDTWVRRLALISDEKLCNHISLIQLVKYFKKQNGF